MYLIVLDFGYTKDPTIPSSIHDLGDYAIDMIKRSHGWTVLAQTEVYGYLAEKCPKMVEMGWLRKIDVCQSGKENGSGLKDGGSYYVLKRGFEMVKELRKEQHELPFVSVLAHRVHRPRVKRQAKLFDKYANTIADGPERMYSTAAQWWCRNKVFWYFRELIGYIPLKLSKQI